MTTPGSGEPADPQLSAVAAVPGAPGPHERAGALGSHVDRARAAVAALAARIEAGRAAAHGHYTGADVAAGDVAAGEAESLSREHAAALGRLEALRAAQLAVEAERQRADMLARLDVVRDTEAQAAAEAEEHAAAIRPSVSAARAEMRAALDAQQRARVADGQRQQLEQHLGLRTGQIQHSLHAQADEVIQNSRLLLDLLRDPEF